MSDDVSSKVKKIVADHLGIDEAKVTEESSFIDDLGADSLDTVELVMAFEEEFGSEISDTEAEKILTVCAAEQDGSTSHGLFRIPGYVKSLKSKKVNGKANPTINNLTQNAIRVDGDYGFAPVAINVGIPALIEITKNLCLAENHQSHLVYI